MVLLPHSAFIGLEGFSDIIESAEILHDYHNVPLKNASSMITATRNYIQCTMFVSIMCNMQGCDIFRELSDRTNGEISKFTHYSIIWCMFYTKCHSIEDGRLTVCPR